MIKTSSLAFSALPSRLTLATTTSVSPTSSKMSTDATAASPTRAQQPMLASQRAKQQKSKDDEMAESQTKPPRSRSMMGFFPLGYKEAVHQWWTSVTPTQAERNVLNLIPYLREATATADIPLQDGAKTDPFGPRVWRSSTVPLSGKNRALNEFSVERVGEQADETLVMLHGYGAGLGFFYRNYEPLSRSPGWKIYSLDMLGMGNSARPPFKIHAKDQAGKITEAEDWFVDALEEWRQARNIERFTLLGHSLGGYLAVSYALKYPGHLNKLILASPAGIPEDPYAVNAAMPEPEDSTFQNEFTQGQEGIVNPSADANNDTLTKVGSNNKAAATKSGTDPPKRPIPGWLVWLWDANVSPFSFVRLAGPLGPRFVSGWTSRRFNHLPPLESQTLHEYSYSLFRQKGSGEYALPYLLAPGAFARSPVINRIQDVGRGVVKPATENEPAVRETGIPVVLMYGDSDWMDVGAGYAAEEKIKARAVKALLHGSEEERRAENGSARVVVVRKAGHHLYLDNPEEFNEVVMKEMEETREWGRRRREMGR
ncbi:alpha/beta-hydrolase [Coniochaeta ligniaria NRRL 30616]|uniref:Alpha/beta-hydrolase n=1 Tax=Coniochaeta ligniaria NRRL 30616 TaxID=1408157 RepID=A0A1J7IM82_9PEZI|nr:alpha/beta-hydrolase [Coniochaeta ligniaria NRRL 30616]